jgi:hypothetical protein
MKNHILYVVLFSVAFQVLPAHSAEQQSVAPSDAHLLLDATGGVTFSKAGGDGGSSTTIISGGGLLGGNYFFSPYVGGFLGLGAGVRGAEFTLIGKKTAVYLDIPLGFVFRYTLHDAAIKNHIRLGGLIAVPFGNLKSGSTTLAKAKTAFGMHMDVGTYFPINESLALGPTFGFNFVFGGAYGPGDLGDSGLSSFYDILIGVTLVFNTGV